VSPQIFSRFLIEQLDGTPPVFIWSNSEFDLDPKKMPVMQDHGEV
jgi:hypothetical protein